MVQISSEFFQKSGLLPSLANDARRNLRFCFCSCADATFHALAPEQEPLKCVVVTGDLSRSGLSLLHDKQAFPGQKIDLVLGNGTERKVKVVRCRRQKDGQFLIGCRFVQKASE
jgi:hypothetical protein